MGCLSTIIMLICTTIPVGILTTIIISIHNILTDKTINNYHVDSHNNPSGNSNNIYCIHSHNIPTDKSINNYHVDLHNTPSGNSINNHQINSNTFPVTNLSTTVIMFICITFPVESYQPLRITFPVGTLTTIMLMCTTFPEC